MIKKYYLAFVPTDGFFAIFSPDFPEITSQGTDMEDCMRMGADALEICFSEYSRQGRALPLASDLPTAKSRIASLLQELEATVDVGSIVWRQFATPQPVAMVTGKSARISGYQYVSGGSLPASA